MTRKLRFSSLLLLLLLVVGAGGAEPEPDLKTFEQRLLLVRELETTLQRTSEDDAKRVAGEHLRKVDAQKPVPNLPAALFFSYYQNRLRAKAGNLVVARTGLVELAPSSTLSPEALEGLEEINYWTKDFVARVSARRLRAKVLPVSEVGRLEDRLGSPWHADIQFFGDGPPSIPAGPFQEHVAVADRYAAMRMHREAATLYVEALYSRFPASRVIDPYGQNNTSLSAAAAPLWLKAADMEYRAGNVAAMADYLAKAVVFGDEEAKDAGLKLLHRLRDQGVPAKEEPKPDAATLKAIAESYAKMNMHPRAIDITRRHAALLGPDAKKLEEKYAKEWLDRVALYCAPCVGKKAMLFGQEVYPVENRLKLTIPYPCSPEALAEVAKALKPKSK